MLFGNNIPPEAAEYVSKMMSSGLIEVLIKFLINVEKKTGADAVQAIKALLELARKHEAEYIALCKGYASRNSTGRTDTAD